MINAGSEEKFAAAIDELQAQRAALEAQLATIDNAIAAPFFSDLSHLCDFDLSLGDGGVSSKRCTTCSNLRGFCSVRGPDFLRRLELGRCGNWLTATAGKLE